VQALAEEPIGGRQIAVWIQVILVKDLQHYLSCATTPGHT
jgi:hypothetical protein